MADETGIKISQLPLGENLADNDLMYAVEDGVSKKVKVSYLQNRIVGDVDSTPTADSDNLVTSGGVYNMVHTLDFNVFHDMAQISNSIADAFSASESYSEGDYVVYDYSLYKFTADKSAGAWDSSKATPVAVTNEIGSGGTTVVPNPSGEATDTLEKLQIDQTIYDFAASNVYGEASGAIASFADGSANPLKSLEVDINPVQAGSGTPSPDNVRPISGWSSVEVTVAGKNLLDGLQFAENISDYGYNAILNTTDKYVRFTRSVKDAETGSFNRPLFELNFKPNTAYTVIFSYINNSTNSSIAFEYTDGTVQQLELVSSSNQKRTYVNSSNGSKTVKRIILSWFSDGQTDLYYEESGLFEGVLTAQDFEPYVGTTTTVSLGQTVYGGKLNVTTGELTVDRALVDLGTLNWSYASNVQAFGSNQFSPFCLTNGRLVCTQYEWNSTPNVTPSNMSDGQISASPYFNRRTVMVKDSRYTDAATFKTAVSGVMLCYELETPTTATLTPTEVDSLLGNNNIWADTGDSDVVYIRNLNLFLNQLDTRVKALENA